MNKPLLKFRLLSPFASKRKKISGVLLIIWILNLVLPSAVYALTSGPAQPETQAFQPVGITDMVDLSSGDFKYNIPLMDVDGYPLNLVYQSGAGIDDEASWVGLGWNMNIGAINRQLRGIADDAMGADDASGASGDKIDIVHDVKKKVTIGGKLSGKLEFKGKLRAAGGKGPSASGTVNIGIFTDNYTGIGAEVGANAGISLSMLNDGAMTAGLGLGVTSSTANGASIDVSPSLNMTIGEKTKNNLLLNSSLSFGMNSRSGTKALTLGAGYSANGKGDKMGISAGFSSSASLITYNTDPIMPSVAIPFKTSYGSVNFDIGPTEAVLFLGGGGTGYVNVREVENRIIQNNAYGFLYAERAKDDPKGVMDFIREKDNPVIPEIPSLAIPIQLPDLFSYTSQSGSGQFRLYRGTAAYGDNETVEESSVTSVGGDLGLGLTNTHIGLTLFRQDSKTSSRRWESDNNFLAQGDFQKSSDSAPFPEPSHDPVYFKMVGEKNQEDPNLHYALENNFPYRVNLINETRTSSAFFVNKGGETTPLNDNKKSSLYKKSRQVKRTPISYLTASQATFHGLEKTTKFYTVNDVSKGFNATTFPKSSVEIDEPRSNQTNRKGHHLSEITVTDDGGKRMVYGIPVYNTLQEESSFAIGSENAYKIINKNQVEFSLSNATDPHPNHKKGIDHYYHKESQPAYASSFLLTGILSPEYVDKTENGITPDDAGTAIKFNYSKIKGVNPANSNLKDQNYKWRTPYGQATRDGYYTATINRGLLADPDDDKASIVYGEKELCYVHSIENKSRTKIAYFITEDRLDGLGVSDWKGAQSSTVKQKRLKEIRLYDQEVKSTGLPVLRLIKAVKFEYDYELCPYTPNSKATGKETPVEYQPGGKLTLRKVWFEYGNTNKGSEHPYNFSYKNTKPITTAGITEEKVVNYSNLSTDRWGTYKPDSENPFPKGVVAYNDLFPYSLQNSRLANENASLWQLDQIELPTGGKIGVTYESDDYAYVQNRKAMEIRHLDALIDGTGNKLAHTDGEALIKARGLRIKLDKLVDSLPLPADFTTPEKRLTWFKNTYLDGSDYLYTKLYVKLATGYSDAKGQEWDFVPCYAKINTVLPLDTIAGVPYLKVLFEELAEHVTESDVVGSPIIFAAWQKLKNDYPRYAYPGFENKPQDGEDPRGAIMRAVKAVVAAIETLGELKRNFYEKAFEKKFAGYYNPDKSFIRLVKTDGIKLGGGARVHQIRISDEWEKMTSPPVAGTTDATVYNYGQQYDYSTMQNGRKISSGVASYEPSIGGDENPLKQPLPYIQKIKGALNNYFSLEEPFGESLYPAATIVYSKVTVTDLNAKGMVDPRPKTGYIVNEFYTSKDFPVRVSRTEIKREHYRPPAAYTTISSRSEDELALSQGYSIELNDMAGKPRATRVFNQDKAEISSTEYFYNSEKTGPDEYRLKNMVSVVDGKGIVSTQKVIGRDVDFYTDMREQESRNDGISIQSGVDLVGKVPLVVPIPHWPGPPNSERKLFRSACAVKVAQYYGIIDKVVKTENGSSISTENMAYDGITGEALVTKTQNEFNQDIYSINLPAYWVYKGMGGAYQNLGMILNDLTTDAAGVIQGGHQSYLHAGDELVDVGSESHYWVIETEKIKKLIKRDGAVSISSNLKLAKVIRSGYRNMLGASTSSLVCLNNPIQTNKTGQQQLIIGDGVELLGSGELSKVKAINASATIFDEHWAPEVAKIEKITSTVITPPTTYYVWGKITEIQDHNMGKWQRGYLEIRFYKSTSSTIFPPSEYNGYSQKNLIDWNGGKIEFQDVVSTNNQSYIKEKVVCQYSATIHSNTSYFSSSSDHKTSYFHNTSKGGRSCFGSHIMDQIKNAQLPNDGRSVFSFTENINQTISWVTTFSNGELTACLGTAIITNPPYTVVENAPINPYVQGYLGNWRLSGSKVYQEGRNANGIFNPAQKGVNIKDAGYFSAFNSYWQPTSNGWSVKRDLKAKWVTANAVTLYDKYGQELENKDALGRYSAAKFDFNGELPSAVASNAMNREIYVNSFEDRQVLPRKIGLVLNEPDYSNIHEFFTLTPNKINVKELATNNISHTGNYSLPLLNVIYLSTITHNQFHKSGTSSNPYLGLTAKKEYSFLNTVGLYPAGFEPLTEQNEIKKKYIFNAWVKDTHPGDKNVDVSLKIIFKNPKNKTLVTDNIILSCKAIVEGWKLMEGIIDMNKISGSDFTISLAPVVPGTAGLYLDDIRIHPIDAHMKTYAYNDKTRKLMAELDENCFATLYEYDDEGSLIRVKKETERGIMTIKESRSSYRKR